MIDTMKPYPEYKDSGLPWLGCIPQHWEVRRNGRLFMQRNSTGYGHLPILEVSLKTGVRVRNMDSLKRKQVISDRNKYKWAAKGDIAYNMMRMWQGAVGVAPVDGLVSPAYVVVRPRSEVEPRYFSHLFRTDIYKKEVDGFSRGIVKDRNRLYWEDFKRIPSCFPSLAEQKIIADYLDANAVKVRRFIRNRRRLIEVLNEQKQAIINQAVIQGLDPDTPLKPTGIDWLGYIPEHWKACRLKHLLSRPLTYGANAAAESSDRNCPRYIRITDIDKYGHLKSDSFCSLPPKVAEPYMLQDGDILLARSGATVGKSFLYSSQQDGPAAHAGYLINARVDQRKVLPAYLYTCLQSAGYWRWIASMTIQATIQNVSAEKYANLWISVPPVDEQRSIIESVEEETTLPMALSSRAEQEIALIREYRTRLISDVVTGKIDVRHLVLPPGSEDLEETFEALEPLEDVGIDDGEAVNESY